MSSSTLTWLRGEYICLWNKRACELNVGLISACHGLLILLNEELLWERTGTDRAAHLSPHPSPYLDKPALLSPLLAFENFVTRPASIF